MRDRKKSGDPLTLSAADWNTFLDAADRVLGGRNNRRDNTNTHRRDCHDITAYNATGSTVDQFGIAGLDVVNATPTADLVEFKQQRHAWQIVDTTHPTHLGQYGIAQEPIAAGAYGIVRVAGVTICQITGTQPDTEPFFAEMEEANATSLKWCHRGSAQVLYYDPAGWGIVRLGNAWRPGNIQATLTTGNTFEEETATDPHTAGTITGIDTLWQGASTVDVYNPLEIKLWSGCKVFAHYNCTEERWEVYAATSNKVVHGIKRIEDECKFEKLDGAAGWNDWDEGATYQFVTDVTYSEGSCSLHVTGCDGNTTDYSLNFVTSVEATATVLYYTKCDGFNYLIANIGPCVEDPVCGTTTWTVQDVAGTLTWVLTSDDCTGTCVDQGPPATAAIVEGQEETLACEEPPP